MTKKEILKTIRAKCLDCTLDQKKEVELCPVKDCALWPFRLGKDPYLTHRTMTEAQKEALAVAQKKSAAKRKRTTR